MGFPLLQARRPAIIATIDLMVKERFLGVDPGGFFTEVFLCFGERIRFCQRTTEKLMSNNETNDYHLVEYCRQQ